MKKILAVCLLLCLLATLAACAPGKRTARINLYYNNEDNSKILIEERTVEVPQGKTLPQVAVEELLKGPKKEGLKSNIPGNTKLLGIKVEDKQATVNFSKEFGSFPGVMAESFAVISVVNTLADLPDIEKVLILVEGKELTAPSGAPYGPLARYDIEKINRDLNKVAVTLYFTDENAMYLEPEVREVERGEKPLEQIVVEELIKGPTKPGLSRTIPEGTKLLSIEVKDGIAYVNFSKEFKENHWGGSTGEAMTINSVVNSLTELPGIEKVQFLIEGKKEGTLAGHMIFNEPFSRNENIIKKK
ncbi:GerMN domain-containing protein [Thermosediminibacter litoriperuensis]|uniref:Germination protein M n=1 Tax=Thermosediminibacter litoriperuensis TaxID=291989 RepID=A0A5S5AJV0_9FIRM|nr:GerMN domain-containing protein [Thermosediminibacter litoriperuensis]TYP50864.1 germination protein M [Thermosediminibacter litoriperuensis]